MKLTLGLSAFLLAATLALTSVAGTQTIRPAQAQAVSDRDVLVVLYNATDGPNWTQSSNWLSDKPLREWHGVTADWRTGRVTVLDLSSNNLSGELPPELGSLSNLQTLNLYTNQLTGEIPPELGSLSNLTSLRLYTNQLTGEIPPELGSLTNLETLNLRSNQLTGEIPPALGSLANLQALRLRGHRQRNTRTALARLPPGRHRGRL